MQRTRVELTFLFTLEHCWVDMAKAKFLQVSQVTQITLRMYLPNYFDSFENYPWSCFQYLHNYINKSKRMFSRNCSNKENTQSVAQEITAVILWIIYMQNTALLDGPNPNLPLSKQILCMHAYQGSMHPRPVSELKWGLVSQARILEFVGSQQTLPSSEGLRTRKETEREGEGKKKKEREREENRKKGRKRKEKQGKRKERET